MATVAEIVTNTIIKKLESGVIPWHKLGLAARRLIISHKSLTEVSIDYYLIAVNILPLNKFKT